MERGLTREEIFQTLTPKRITCKPRPERVRVGAVPVDFVTFRNGQGVLVYATPAAYYGGPEVNEGRAEAEPGLPS
jgi:hypothetical protein